MLNLHGWGWLWWLSRLHLLLHVLRLLLLHLLWLSFTGMIGSIRDNWITGRAS
jgi:hypothetical protein